MVSFFIMSDHWREILYLPLGMIPSIFFTWRILCQWLRAEKKMGSNVTPFFWKISLAGNLFLLLHYIIQVQFPFAFFQCCNAVIAWRNLNLMKSRSPCSTKQTLTIALLSIASLTLIFLLQSSWLIGEIDWIRTPKKPFDALRTYHTLGWHIFGSVGGFIFSSRFWVQWWLAEQSKRSELGRVFWILSIAGTAISLVYFAHIRDYVSLFYNCFALIPYMRNLVLLRKIKRVKLN